MIMRQTPPLSFILVLPLVLLSLFSIGYAHNITIILAKISLFSTFNHYLTLTDLAYEINSHLNITILAMDNDAMSSFLSKGLSLSTIKNVLSHHVLAGYLGSKELHQLTNGKALTATMFQASGSIPVTSRYVNIISKGGKVGFSMADNGSKLDAIYVKALYEEPYNISVLHISQEITSPLDSAPCSEPNDPNPPSSQKNTIWLVLAIIGFLLMSFLLRGLCRGCQPQESEGGAEPAIGFPVRRPTGPEIGVPWPVEPTAPPLEMAIEMQRIEPISCPSCGYRGGPYIFHVCPSCGCNF